MTDLPAFFWLFCKFSGRVSRKAYLLSMILLMLVVSFPLYQFVRLLPEGESIDDLAIAPIGPEAQMWSAIFLLIALASLWGQIAISVKRLHDVGRPGIMVLSLFIPIISFVAFIALCVWPGDPNANRYGPRPDLPQ